MLTAKDLPASGALSGAAHAKSKTQTEAHLSDPFTSRDLFGVVRGKCTGCSACPGGYLKRTADYTLAPEDLFGEGARLHPHNDPTLLDCNRCGCPAGAHEVAEGDNLRELGNDAFCTGDLNKALRDYSRGIAAAPGDARGYSNRAAVLLAMAGVPVPSYFKNQLLVFSFACHCRIPAQIR